MTGRGQDSPIPTFFEGLRLRGEVVLSAVKKLNLMQAFCHFLDLRLERGGPGQRISLNCACFLISQLFMNIYRHIIHQTEAEYHIYPRM